MFNASIAPAEVRIRTARLVLRRLGLALVASTATVAVAACGSTKDPMAGHNMSPSMAPSTSASAPVSATPATGAHNDADIMFATMMIPHHAQAVEMSNMLLGKDGIDAKAVDLAGRIKAAQAPEITQMSGWLAGWGQDPSPSGMGDMQGMDHGDGMMSRADMDALDKATGNQATKLYLTGMIKHHQGAVTMAQLEIDQGTNPDAKKLAHNIITAQQAEITEMNQLLSSY